MEELYRKYFNQEILEPPEFRDTITPLIEKDELKEATLIAGDFFGIQKFIFDNLSTKRASKVLRAKSAYVQLLTRVASYKICDSLSIGIEHIISVGAGKFEILAPRVSKDEIDKITRELDDYFVERFFGLSGIGVSSIDISLSEWKNNYKALRDRVSKEVEASKFNRFNLQNRSPILELDGDLNNSKICPICNLRKKESDKEGCKLCNDFIELGKKLTTKDTISFVRGKGEIEILPGYGIVFKEVDYAIEIFDISKEAKGSYPHWSLSSYVKTSQDGKIVTFEELAKEALSVDEKGNVVGLEALAVLKADVDNMGNFIRDSDVTNSATNFMVFSMGLDNFFSKKIPLMMRDKYPNTYTVFAGGDDLFLIGTWGEILDLARDIETTFKSFVKDKSLTISMGIILVKPKLPITYLAEASEEALESSKEMPNKDAITLFKETVKWSIYREKGKELYFTLKEAQECLFEFPTTFLYRLLELLELRRTLLKRDASLDEIMVGAMWKSRLNYTFRRNIFEEVKESKSQTECANRLLNILNIYIEEYPEITKMVLSEFIYKRRRV